MAGDVIGKIILIYSGGITVIIVSASIPEVIP
jgi:hypothetical protein